MRGDNVSPNVARFSNIYNNVTVLPPCSRIMLLRFRIDAEHWIV